jgi:protein SCO1/2
MNKVIKISIPLIFVFSVIVGLYVLVIAELPQPMHALYYPEGKKINDFQLTDHQDQSFSKKQIMNKWSFVFLGYTSCPHVCSPTLQNLHFIYNDLKAIAPNTEVLLITVDPKRDSQAVLSQFISHFNSNFKALRGEHDVLFPLVRNLGLTYAFTEQEVEQVTDGSSNSDNYWVDHSAALVLINPEGKIAAVFKPEKEKGQSASFNNEKLLSDYIKIVDLYANG